MKRVALAWSSGKDSAWSLYRLRQDPNLEVVALFTNFEAATRRVTMHGVFQGLVEAQAERTSLPLWPFSVPWPCSNQEYERVLGQLCRRAREESIEALAFGDLFLKDIRDYRESQLAGSGLEPIFPLWGMPTRQLAAEMIDGGLRARLTCVELRKLSASFAGREFDHGLLADLPGEIDPCGENGEFHTFVTDGPVFASPIRVVLGETAVRSGFLTIDVAESGSR